MSSTDIADDSSLPLVATARFASVRGLTRDRRTAALCLVFLALAAFYLLTAYTAHPAGVHEPQGNPYNLLATAFLHLRLSVGAAPAQLLHIANPYDPAQNAIVLSGVHPTIDDFVLYHDRLFLTWGPAPAIVLAALHLLGLAPSSSVATAAFAILGLAFALGALRLILRHLGDPPVWMCVLAASTLGLASAVPFILHNAGPYEEAIASGYLFTMAGLWLAIAAITQRTASSWRLACMSLCFGLAASSRPTLVVASVALVPVYLALRSSRGRRGLLLALLTPLAICGFALLAYNQARFGSPLEIGVRYQLAGVNPQTAHFGELEYVPTDVWAYLMAPPRADVLFPFLVLPQPPLSYPGVPFRGLRAEPTGGLLPMAPILVFLAALPWLWRRRPALLGALAPFFLLLAAGAAVVLLFLSYEFFATTERYEVDFATLLLLGALAAWLAFCTAARGRRRALLKLAGGAFALWGCFTAIAASIVGYTNPLFIGGAGAFTAFEDAGSPISEAIASLVGHPLIARLSAPGLTPLFHIDYGTLGVGDTSFSLDDGEQAELTVVSPTHRLVTLVAHVRVPPEDRNHVAYRLEVTSASQARYSTPLEPPGGPVRISVHLDAGVNRLALQPVTVQAAGTAPSRGSPALIVNGLSLAR